MRLIRPSVLSRVAKFSARFLTSCRVARDRRAAKGSVPLLIPHELAVRTGRGLFAPGPMALGLPVSTSSELGSVAPVNFLNRLATDFTPASVTLPGSAD